MSSDADPASRNRLDEEESPYLRQHADNPVNWQPWDDEALAAARERDVPIFLSIGYAACHWCHVMAEESFADEAVAATLNESFVPIKVDREERPDLDSLYITVCRMVRGQAGWPLSVFLTPDGRPFFVGTYVPREPKRGQPGFEQLCADIADSWADPEGREEIEERADEWAAALAEEVESVPEPGEPPDESFLEAAAEAALRAADREHGGFGRGQKFPNPGRLHLLARATDRLGDENDPAEDQYRQVVVETLDAMANNGLYDHVGGGFHRYCTDRSWTVPHFEKMLYDNAELPRAFLAGYQLTGRERYAEVVHETFEFLTREMRHPRGGFYATLDAESENPEGEREEGTYYVWTPETVREAMEAGARGAEVSMETELLADLFADRYGVTEAGNFEDGRTVLTRSASIETLAERHDVPVAEVADRLPEAERRAVEYRETRPRPPRDEKVLAGWNGLAISAFAEGALVLDPEYAEPAAEALAFVRDRLWDDDDRTLHRRYKDGDVKGRGYLEDYAFLARGAFDLYQATGEVDHLAVALELGRAIRAEFYDPDAGTLYFTPAGGEDLIARPQEPADQSTPSSMGVAASLFAALDQFAPEEGFGAVAEAVIERQASRIENDPLQHASLTLAADALAAGHLELTVVADALPPAWRERLAGEYLPTRLLSVRPPDQAALDDWLGRMGVDETPPIWAGRDPRDGRPTVYACRSFTCSPPAADIDEALEWAEQLGPDGGPADGFDWE